MNVATSFGYKKYQDTQINTVNRGKLLIMMYEGAIKFLHLAKKRMLEKKFADTGIFLSKAIAIISELTNTLNIKEGGEIAINLKRLYNFMLYHLTFANLEKNPRSIEDVEGILSILKDAYSEALKLMGKENRNSNL